MANNSSSISSTSSLALSLSYVASPLSAALQSRTGTSSVFVTSPQRSISPNNIHIPLLRQSLSEP